MNKKPIKGKRMKVFITDGFDPVELKGVQAFGYKSNVIKEGHSEYGSDGNVITIVSFENITGSIDTEDQNDDELISARAMMTGRRANDSTGIDFANVKSVWLWKNNYDPYDPKKEIILSSDLLRAVEFDEDYKSQINSIHTRSFQFQGLRGINFPRHAIKFESFAGDGAFSLSHTAVSYLSEDGLENNSSGGYILALFVNGEWAMDKIETATDSSFILKTPLANTDKVVVLYLYDGEKKI